jgi:ATP-dependent DNA helicase RecG
MDKHAMHLKLTKLLSVGRETERTEFKVDNSNPQEIGEYISSLSNAACLHDVPKGYLIYGVENQTCDVVGTNFQPRKTKKGGEELENWLARHLDPRVHFSIEEIVFQEKRVVVFEIEAARTQPVKFKGKPYIRVGTCQQNLDAHPGKERKIWINASQSRFEDGVAMEDVLAEDITEYLNWDSYFRLLKHRMPRDLDVILETLTREKLIRESGSRYHITNLGAILFARDLDQFGPLARKAVRVIIYRGNDRLKTVKEQIGRFGYAVGFEGLVTFITDRLPSNEEIGKIFRKDIKMYPELAIRELVANALIHQDFKETGCGPMVEIFN